MNKKNIEFFQDMVLDCCGLFSWSWDAEFKLLRTNFQGERKKLKIELAEDGKNVIKEHIQNNRMPIIFCGTSGMNWVSVFHENENGDVDTIHVLGPSFQMEVSEQILEKLVCPLELAGIEKRKFMEKMRTIPVISSIYIFQYAIFLHYCVTGEKIGVNDLVHYKQDAVKWKAISSMDTKPHSPGIIRRTLIDMVKTGNLDYHHVWERAASTSTGIRMEKTAPLQQAKYSVAIFVGACAYAAIDGGLPSETAYNLCDMYVTTVEHCQTLSELATVNHMMYEDFVCRVNQLQAGNISKEIWMCRDYIIAHIEEKISLQELAKIAGYEEYYLSRKFKKEMGISLNDFINQTKIQRAKALLSTTNMNIEDVVEQLQFSSRTYFTDVFQKVEGISPSEYRKKPY